MKVKEMIEKLDLKLLTKDVSEDALYAEVEGGYASDLLSNAMGQGQPGMVWVTMQGRQNGAAVASLIGFAITFAFTAVPQNSQNLLSSGICFPQDSQCIEISFV